PYVAIGVYLTLCLLAFWGFMKWPSSYIPEEDQGFFMTSVQLPTGASLDRTDKIVTSLSDSILKIPEVANTIAISGQSMMGGGSGGNVGSLFVVLKPWKERQGKGKDVNSVIDRVNNIAASYQEPIIFSINPPAIPGLGMTSGATMQILDINNLGAEAIAEAVNSMRELGEKDDRLAQITSQYQGAVPQYAVKVDRDRAKLLGLELEDIYSTLSQFMGGSYVNDFVKFGRTYQVNISADENTRSSIDGIPSLTVRNSSGEMVPFSSFAKVVSSSGQSSVSRYNMYTTAQITGTPARNVSSEDGIEAMKELLKKAVGDKFSYAWTGEAYQETEAGT
ncbi:MAG: efflux RND transporter permease subunit, partial [Duncaniella sp.]|nr:efflux RND transporter permease subunit [Duncaniella sp.]